MPAPVVDTVNVGMPRPNPFRDAPTTGIDKRPTPDPVEVRDPGPKRGGLGSGIVGDFVGDRQHHGGEEQALYAFQREDLDGWQERLDREVPNGFFGENLTTSGIDVNDSRVGEIWRIGDTVEVKVTGPRLPCSTFRGWVGEAGWLRTFTLEARPGAYLRILVPGLIRSGDPITVLHRPDHEISMSFVYRASTTDRAILPRLLEAGDDLPTEFRAVVARGKLVTLG